MLDARTSMIEQLLRPAGLKDERVLDAFMRIPQEPFLLPEYQALAYADAALPIGKGQIMNNPREMALVLQALEIEPTDKILEVGTGSGYWTAFLAVLGGSVISLEIEPSLLKRAAAVLKQQNLAEDLVLEEGNGADGWAEHAPYDVVILTGAVPVLPVDLLSQLKKGGRLWAVVGAPPLMQGQLLTQEDNAHFKRETLFETYWPVLQGTTHETAFHIE